MNCTRKNLSLLKLVYLRCILYININDWLSIVLAFRQNTYLTQTFLKQILNNIRNQTFILSLILVCLKVQNCCTSNFQNCIQHAIYIFFYSCMHLFFRKH